MALNSFIGSTVEVSPSAPTGGLTQTTFEALSGANAFVEIGQLQMIGEVGDTVNMIDIPLLKDSRINRVQGMRDGGNTALTIAYDGNDTVQTLIRDTYAYSDVERSIRIVDPADAGGKDWYFTTIFADIRWGQRDGQTAYQFTALIYPRMHPIGPFTRN